MLFTLSWKCRLTLVLPVGGTVTWPGWAYPVALWSYARFVGCCDRAMMQSWLAPGAGEHGPGFRYSMYSPIWPPRLLVCTSWCVRLIAPLAG